MSAFNQMWVEGAQRIRASLDQMRRARSRSRAIRELEALPDRLLQDIGIERHAIPLVVDELITRRSAEARSDDLGEEAPPVHEGEATCCA